MFKRSLLILLFNSSCDLQAVTLLNLIECIISDCHRRDQSNTPTWSEFITYDLYEYSNSHSNDLESLAIIIRELAVLLKQFDVKILNKSIWAYLSTNVSFRYLMIDPYNTQYFLRYQNRDKFLAVARSIAHFKIVAAILALALDSRAIKLIYPEHVEDALDDKIHEDLIVQIIESLPDGESDFLLAQGSPCRLP